MKNKTMVMNERIQNKFLDWMYLEGQEDDFLMGKTPVDLGEAWDEEE